MLLRLLRPPYLLQLKMESVMRSSTGHSAASIRQRTNGSAPGIWRAARGAWCAVPTALLCLLVVLTGRIAAAAEVDEMLLRGRVTADAHGVPRYAFSTASAVLKIPLFVYDFPAFLPLAKGGE